MTLLPVALMRWEVFLPAPPPFPLHVRYAVTGSVFPTNPSTEIPEQPSVDHGPTLASQWTRSHVVLVILTTSSALIARFLHPQWRDYATVIRRREDD